MTQLFHYAAFQPLAPEAAVISKGTHVTNETRERAAINLHLTRRGRRAHTFIESKIKAYSAAV